MRSKLFLAFLLSILYFIVPKISYADASLSFSPQRIVMSGKDRSATLQLSNRGDKIGTYRISMSDVLYNTDGSVKHVSKAPPGYPSARPFIRFSPRQVRLAPGESQKIRILLKPSSVLSNREVRVHALLKQIPDAKKPSVQGGNKTISGSVGIAQSIALPVIVRRGERNVQGGMAAISRGAGKLRAQLWRKGNHSIYSNFEIYSGAVNPSRQVALVKGVAVPVPNTQRFIEIKLKDQAKRPPYIVIMRDHDTGEIIDQKTVR